MYYYIRVTTILNAAYITPTTALHVSTTFAGNSKCTSHSRATIENHIHRFSLILLLYKSSNQLMSLCFRCTCRHWRTSKHTAQVYDEASCNCCRTYSHMIFIETSPHLSLGQTVLEYDRLRTSLNIKVFYLF